MFDGVPKIGARFELPEKLGVRRTHARKHARTHRHTLETVKSISAARVRLVATAWLWLVCSCECSFLTICTCTVRIIFLFCFVLFSLFLPCLRGNKKVSVLRRELLMEKHKNAHLEGELVKLRKSAVEIVSATPVLQIVPAGTCLYGRWCDMISV